MCALLQTKNYYSENTLSALPGTIIGVFVINIIGGKIMLGNLLQLPLYCTHAHTLSYFVTWEAIR